MNLKDYIREIPDFPQKGILYRDITPLLGNAEAFSVAIDRLSCFARRRRSQVIAGIESRGFIGGAALALQLGLPFVPIRKDGKLPYKTRTQTYDLEYGTDKIQIHVDAFSPDQRILLVDDLIATGGTACAASELVESLGGVVTGICALMQLPDLGAELKLGNREVFVLVRDHD